MTVDVSSEAIQVNGTGLDGYTWSRHVRFCPSTNDHLVGVLTVKEHIMLSSRLSNGGDPAYDHDRGVTEILARLGLTGCQHSRVGTIYKRGISGGQQRRTCMAIELIVQVTTFPSIIRWFPTQTAYNIRNVAQTYKFAN